MTQFRLLFLVVCSLIVMSLPLFGQQATTKAENQKELSPSLDLKISQVLQGRVRNFIGRFVPENHFQVIVRAQADRKKFSDLPYVPGVSEGGLLSDKSIRELIFLSSSVDITIWFVREVSSTVAEQIVSLLNTEAELNAERGDRISTKVLNISRDDLETGAGRLMKKIESVQEDLIKVKEERDEVKRNLSFIQMNLDKALKEKALDQEAIRNRDREYTKVKQQFDELQKNEAQLQSEYSKLKDQLEQSAIHKLFSVFGNSLFLAIAALISALIFVFGMTRAFSSLGQGIKKLSEGLSGSISSLAHGLSSYEGGSEGLSQDESELYPKKSNSVDVTETVPGIEELKVYQSGLREEINKLWKDEFESDVIIYIDTLIRKYQKPSHAMIVFEIIGQEKSKKVFQRLSKDAREAVSKFIRNAHYEKPKSSMIIEVGENLKTILFAEYISKSETNLDQDIVELLVKVDFDFIVQAVVDMDHNLIARFLLYMEAERISDILKILHKRNPERFSLVSEKLGELPDAQSEADLDSMIKKYLDDSMQVLQSDRHQPYYYFYRELIEKSGDEISENIMSELARKNEGLAQFLRSSVITFNSIFSLSESQISGLIGKLTNHEIGVILSCIGDEGFRKKLLESFGERRQQMILDELDVVSGRPQEQVDSQFKNLKGRITRNLRNSGLITDSG
ncbi:MAG: hypothetical protein H6618_00665 [Deltaproteobacteria bacterium]|nr:hypothetical protein [Deltaproteobacteria bacterium]